MKNDKQSPRDWLFDRHEAAEERLDALRRNALPKPGAGNKPGRPWGILVPMTTARGIAAISGLAAVLVAGFTIYETKFHRAAATTPVVINHGRADPRPLPNEAATPPATQVRSDPYPVGADRDAGIAAPASGTSAPLFPHRSPAQIAEIANQVPNQNPQVPGAANQNGEIAGARQRLAEAQDRLVQLQADLLALERKRALDAKLPKASPTDAEITRLEEELARLKAAGISAPPVSAQTTVPAPASGAPGPRFPDQSRAQIVAAADQIPNQSAPARINGIIRLPVNGAGTSAKSTATNDTPPPPAAGTAAELYPSNAFVAGEPAQKAGPADPSAKPGWKSVSNWSNAGNATPAAAFETWLWADVNRQPEAWLSTVALSDAAREKIAAHYQGLPEAERTKYATAGVMFAVMSMSMHPLGWSGMTVLKQTAKGPGDIDVVIEWQFSDGRVRENTRPFHRYDDGWKMPYTDNTVEGILSAQRSREMPENK